MVNSKVDSLKAQRSTLINSINILKTELEKCNACEKKFSGNSCKRKLEMLENYQIKLEDGLCVTRY